MPSDAPRIDSSLTYQAVVDGLEHLKDLKVAVVGETIIDEYAYTDAIGKSGKEPVLVTRFSRCEKQAGGVLAIANHLADFCSGVTLVSALGESEREEDFVRGALREEVTSMFITKPQSPTIVKRRYIDSLTGSKLMGVYRMNSIPLPDAQGLCALLKRVLAQVDVVIVADYGHGLLTPPSIETLCREAPFLALNTQLNADNHGYNVMSKYRRADYACGHEGEIRLDARDEFGQLDSLLERTLQRLDAQAIMATLGKRGTAVYERGGSIERCPALARKVVERVGAGDAVLALSSLAMAGNLGGKMAGLLGNLAGAQAVSVVGNQASISKENLLTHAAQCLPPAAPLVFASEAFA